MPVQNTFTLVPTAATIAAGRSPAASRLMTSKQVKQAYKEANRMPKMSRAERLKQERAEQERIRKELEREKSAAKARAARDRKKEQERAEREERKRSGRPLVDVRASQNTMTSFFQRGAAPPRAREGITGRPLEQVEEETRSEPEQEPEETENTEGTELEAQAESETKAAEVDGQIQPELKAGGESELQAGLDVRIEPELEPGLDVQIEPELEDELDALMDSEDFAGLDQQQPQPELEREARSKAVDNTDRPGQHSKPPQELALDELLQDDFDDDELDLLLETNDFALDAPSKAPCPSPLKPLPSQVKPLEPVVEKPCIQPPRPETRYERDLGLVAKKRKWHPFIDDDDDDDDDDLASDAQRRKLPSPKQRPVDVLPMAPPPRPLPPPLSTQYIMDDFDDLFPTASQQIREVEEEEIVFMKPPKPVRPANRQPLLSSGPKVSSTKEMPPPPPPPKTTPPETHVSTPPVAAPKSPKRFFTGSSSQQGLYLALHRSRKSAALEALQQKERMRIEAGMLLQQKKEEEELLARREQVNRAKKMQTARQNKTGHGAATPPPQEIKPIHTARAANKPEEKRAVGNLLNMDEIQSRTIKQHAAPIPLVDKENIPPKGAPTQDAATTALRSSSATEKMPSQTITTPSKQGATNTYPSASQESDYGGQWLDEIPLDMDF